MACAIVKQKLLIFSFGKENVVSLRGKSVDTGCVPEGTKGCRWGEAISMKLLVGPADRKEPLQYYECVTVEVEVWFCVVA
jgi:hypothetical protein